MADDTPAASRPRIAVSSPTNSAGTVTRHFVRPSSRMESGGSSEPDSIEKTLFVAPPPEKYLPPRITLRVAFVLGSHRQTEPVASATTPPRP